MHLLIKLIIIIVISVISAIMLRRYKPNKSLRRDIIALIITSIVAFASSEIFDVIDKGFNTPSVTVNIQKANNEIIIDLKIKRSINLFSLNYPVKGLITNLQDLNSINDAFTSTSSITGDSTSNAVQNNLEISVSNLKPDANITYKIFYKPNTSNIFIAGTDRYQYSYVWEYNGKKLYESYWKYVANNSKASAPVVVMRGTTIYNKVLTPEEIKKLDEEGPPKRDLRKTVPKHNP